MINRIPKGRGWSGPPPGGPFAFVRRRDIADDIVGGVITPAKLAESLVLCIIRRSPGLPALSYSVVVARGRHLPDNGGDINLRRRGNPKNSLPFRTVWPGQAGPPHTAVSALAATNGDEFVGSLARCGE
jgi:hypothetical protein